MRILKALAALIALSIISSLVLAQVPCIDCHPKGAVGREVHVGHLLPRVCYKCHSPLPKVELEPEECVKCHTSLPRIEIRPGLFIHTGMPRCSSCHVSQEVHTVHSEFIREKGCTDCHLRGLIEADIHELHSKLVETGECERCHGEWELEERQEYLLSLGRFLDKEFYSELFDEMFHATITIMKPLLKPETYFSWVYHFIPFKVEGRTEIPPLYRFLSHSGPIGWLKENAKELGESSSYLIGGFIEYIKKPLSIFGH